MLDRVEHPGYDTTSVDEPTHKWLINLLTFLQPRFVIEAGTYRGHFAIVAGALLRNQQKGGRVWSFDPTDYGVQGYLVQNKITNVTLVAGGFEELEKQYAYLKGVVDLAFVDSGPDGPAPEGFPADMRWQHYCLAKEYVRPKGLVVVDDLFGDWAHVEEIKAECWILEGGRGVGVWQKR